MVLWVNDPACLYRGAGWIPSLAQWVEDPALLQLWPRLLSLNSGSDSISGLEISTCCGGGQKRKKKKNENNIKFINMKNRMDCYNVTKLFIKNINGMGKILTILLSEKQDTELYLFIYLFLSFCHFLGRSHGTWRFPG